MEPTQQLSLDIPIKITGKNNLVEATAEYEKEIAAGKKNIFLCYCSRPNLECKYQHYFVSRGVTDPSKWGVIVIK